MYHLGRYALVIYVNIKINYAFIPRQQFRKEIKCKIIYLFIAIFPQHYSIIYNKNPYLANRKPITLIYLRFSQCASPEHNREEKKDKEEEENIYAIRDRIPLIGQQKNYFTFEELKMGTEARKVVPSKIAPKPHNGGPRCAYYHRKRYKTHDDVT